MAFNTTHKQCNAHELFFWFLSAIMPWKRGELYFLTVLLFPFLWIYKHTISSADFESRPKQCAFKVNLSKLFLFIFNESSLDELSAQFIYFCYVRLFSTLNLHRKYTRVPHWSSLIRHEKTAILSKAVEKNSNGMLFDDLFHNRIMLFNMFDQWRRNT